MNRNLHSPTKLTEFARDWDEEPETLLSKFVTKITNAYNASYNSVNVAPSTSSADPPRILHPTIVEESLQGASAMPSGAAEREGTPIDVSESSYANTPTDSASIAESAEVRTPTSIMQRISNLVAFGNRDLQSYRDTELQRFWMPDAKSKECYECTQKFSTFRRKHHCRLCGQIFCSKCCNQVVPGKIIKCSEPLKVCTYCSKIVLRYLNSPEIQLDLKSDLQALQDDLSIKLATEGPNISSPDLSVSSPLRRKISVGYQEEKLVSYPNTTLTSGDRKTILQQLTSLQLLSEEFLKNLPMHNRGGDLVRYLMANQKSSDRMQAEAILNTMIEAGFLLVVPPGSEEAEFEEDSLYKTIQKSDILSSQICSRHGGQQNVDVSIVARPAFAEGNIFGDFQDNSISSIKDFDLQNNLLSTAGSKPLLEAFCTHEERLLHQLLRNENLDPEWSKILIPLCARVSNTIKPGQYGADLMDIRGFVNFKKVPGGKRTESQIIGGVAFTKNVAHKDMITKVERPRILLLQCPIVYQRVEGKFVSLETLMLQEEEYLRNVTARIRSLEPNVVLVHKNVAGIAQDMLRKRGITLVLDVKLSVLERLSRYLECDVVSSIDSNIGRPTLGVCDMFCIRTFTDEQGVTKTLMFFEMPSSPRAFCVLLRGGNNAELTRVKRVASFLLYVRYNWRLEMSFLLDEFARPPSPKPNIFDSKEQSPVKPLEEEEATTKSKSLKSRIDDKAIHKEHVPDCSDPLRATNPPAIDQEPESSVVELHVQPLYDNKFRTALSSTVLSVSPFVSFPLPFLETEIGRKCHLRSRFPNELYYSKQFSSPIERIPSLEESTRSEIKKDVAMVKKSHDFVNHKITSSMDSKDLQGLLASFRATGGRLLKTRQMRRQKIDEKSEEESQKCLDSFIYKDALVIENHQRLPVLFCSYNYSPKSSCHQPTFCAQPSFLNMQFYGQNDIMLGHFLERYCFRSSYICPSCNCPMMDHVRRYVHSMGCIQVQLAEDQQKRSPDGGSILITSWCSVCKESTPSVPISNDTHCLSFAKYLEQRFHGHAYKRRDVSVQQENNNAKCNHSLHRQHIHYFSHKGIVASFMYTPIEVWEISLPPLVIQLRRAKPYDSNKVLEDIKMFAQKGYEVYAKIYDRLAQISTEVESPKLLSLKSLVNRDQMIFKQRVEIVQTLLTEREVNSRDINDAMLMVKRALAESIEVWGPRLHEAESQTKNSSSVDSGADVEEGSESTDDGDDVAGKGVSQAVDVIQSEKNNKDFFDKKTVKSLLSQLLPSSGQVNTLQSPLPLHEHHTLPLGAFPILVHDQDLSSMISYSLMSNDYKKCLEIMAMPQVSESGNSPSVKRKSESSGEKEDRESEKSKSSHHIELHFQDSTTQFTCKVYFAREFDLLRNKVLIPPPGRFSGEKESKSMDEVTEDVAKATVDRKCSSNSLGSQGQKPPEYLTAETERVRQSFARSLCRSIQWEAKGGKSGSKFSKTTDDRFVLKEMTKQDVAIFENFAPNYFDYIHDCLQHDKPTLLAKILGVFKVVVKKKDSDREKSVLVMENLFFDREISNKFDLKGSDRNRLVDPTNQEGEIVLLDQNLIQMSWSNPLYILTHSRTILREAIHRDASFLEKNDVMDYSLLVGLDGQEKLLVLGIIDYIRTFTLDKRLESLVKQTGLLGGQGKLPTVISPKPYKQRFSEAMERYFLVVPDRWEGLAKK
ncbi:putative 1-phosphatidylinositol 3-phosphate 5-kinase [Phlebotomus argentipes]|uniref:putative 1-phosphatidylinositol 3-phosphate 5-kinase n=1 Tax=Phlebotomus argentipes TaxID=94469 RepID=UPI0028929E94|nr:putative 1-phosphatidylinositol 3-phosphate 5-kinase [Phlebotomus argentipes]